MGQCCQPHHLLSTSRGNTARRTHRPSAAHESLSRRVECVKPKVALRCLSACLLVCVPSLVLTFDRYFHLGVKKKGHLRYLAQLQEQGTPCCPLNGDVICAARLRHVVLSGNAEPAVLPEVLPACVPASLVQGCSGRYKIPWSFGVSLACG